ncbi:hypothetical protein RNZ50_17615 [Paracoccaceae bacterium Fryx2]|nr:hypothetical protein [Paracoccaceae bacterium Fryx2]
MSDERPKRAERLQLMLTLAEIEKVDTWRFERHMPSRSAAVRALMKLGFGADTSEQSAPVGTVIGVNSRDVGVIVTDARVDEVLEGRRCGRKIIIASVDPILGHALKSLVRDAGFEPGGPFADAEKLRAALNHAEAAAVVFHVDPADPGSVALCRAVPGGFVTVLCMDEAQTADQIGDLRASVRLVGILGAPAALQAALLEAGSGTPDTPG